MSNFADAVFVIAGYEAVRWTARKVFPVKDTGLRVSDFPAHPPDPVTAHSQYYTPPIVTPLDVRWHEVPTKHASARPGPPSPKADSAPPSGWREPGGSDDEGPERKHPRAGLDYYFEPDPRGAGGFLRLAIVDGQRTRAPFEPGVWYEARGLRAPRQHPTAQGGSDAEQI